MRHLKRYECTIQSLLYTAYALFHKETDVCLLFDILLIFVGADANKSDDCENVSMLFIDMNGSYTCECDNEIVMFDLQV